MRRRIFRPRVGHKRMGATKPSTPTRQIPAGPMAASRKLGERRRRPAEERKNPPGHEPSTQRRNNDLAPCGLDATIRERVHLPPTKAANRAKPIATSPSSRKAGYASAIVWVLFANDLRQHFRVQSECQYATTLFASCLRILVGVPEGE